MSRAIRKLTGTGTGGAPCLSGPGSQQPGPFATNPSRPSVTQGRGALGRRGRPACRRDAAAPPGRSQHPCRTAMDLGPVPPGVMREDQSLNDRHRGRPRPGVAARASSRPGACDHPDRESQRFTTVRLPACAPRPDHLADGKRAASCCQILNAETLTGRAQLLLPAAGTRRIPAHARCAPHPRCRPLSSRPNPGNPLACKSTKASHPPMHGRVRLSPAANSAQGITVRHHPLTGRKAARVRYLRSSPGRRHLRPPASAPARKPHQATKEASGTPGHNRIRRARMSISPGPWL
jgi:hypothetical protein